MKDVLISNYIYALKCTISMVIAYLLAKLLVQEDLLSASLVAVLCIKPIFYSGLVSGKEQFFASMTGALITSGFIIIGGNNIIVMAFSMLIVILLCVYKKWHNYLPVAVFTVLYMIILQKDSTIDTMFIRINSVLLGVIVASFINLIFSFIRYKSFFYYRLKYLSLIIYNNLLQTIDANKNANIIELEKLYYSYEDVYNQLNNFSNEIMNIRKELKIRKKAGGLSYESVSDLYRILESLKNAVRYLQDISFISKELAPEHHKIDDNWKEHFDNFWDNLKVNFSDILIRLIENKNCKNINKISFEHKVISEISEKLKESNNRYLLTEVLAIAIDFEQLSYNINNLNYSVKDYIEENY